MEVVAGLSLKNLEPRVWDSSSEFYLSDLSAVMVSYADFCQMRVKRKEAMKEGLRAFLAASPGIQVYLDNGAFYFATNGGAPNAREYGMFVRRAKPDWRPIRFDAIPTPQMAWQTQAACYRRTRKINLAYQHDGYVPVVHVGRYLSKSLDDFESFPKLAAKERIAVGGLVPNLLRTPKAAQYSAILDDLIAVRKRFPNKQLHLFGVGGTATIHLAALLGFDSADSSGWRNRAARGIIQLPGSGERIVADLGRWRGRRLSSDELAKLRKCKCPACQQYGIKGLKADGIDGFKKRATHNLWVLLDEANWVNQRLANKNYKKYFRRRLDNTVYLPLIETILSRRSGQKVSDR